MTTEIVEWIRKIVKKLICIIMLSVNNATDIFLVISRAVKIQSTRLDTYSFHKKTNTPADKGALTISKQ